MTFREFQQTRREVVDLLQVFPHEADFFEQQPTPGYVYGQGDGPGWWIQIGPGEGMFSCTVGNESYYQGDLEGVERALWHAFARDGAEIVVCAKCGAQVPLHQALTDEGEEEEAGRVFTYCSENCKETH